MPSLRKLAEEFSVSHPTVMRAVHSLIEDGFLSVEKKGGYRSLLDSADQAKMHIYGLVNGVGNYSFEFKSQWELNIPLVRSLFARGNLICTKNIFLDKPENLQAAVYENGLSGILLSGSSVRIMEEARKLKDRMDIPIAAFYSPGRSISVAAPDQNAFLQIFEMMAAQKRRKVLLIIRESLLFYAEILAVTERARSMFGMELTILSGTENGISSALQGLYGSGIHFDGVIFFSTLQNIYRQICESEDMEKCRLMIDQFELFREHYRTGVAQQELPAWNFIDWCDGLDRMTACEGCYIFGLRKLAKIARLLKKYPDAKRFEQEAEFLSAELRQKKFDPKKGLFVSGKKNQISYASQIWMILAEVVTGTDARRLLEKMEHCKKIVKPVTPYLHHHLLEAYRVAGEKEKMMRHLHNYWGSMLKKGMNVFPEVFVEEKERLTPYGNDPRINSACHAWSCAPSYFLRMK